MVSTYLCIPVADAEFPTGVGANTPGLFLAPPLRPQNPGTDPGFPRRGCQSQWRMPTYYFGNFFPENCIRIKKFGSREGSVRQ